MKENKKSKTIFRRKKMPDGRILLDGSVATGGKKAPTAKYENIGFASDHYGDFTIVSPGTETESIIGGGKVTLLRNLVFSFRGEEFKVTLFNCEAESPALSMTWDDRDTSPSHLSKAPDLIKVLWCARLAAIAEGQKENKIATMGEKFHALSEKCKDCGQAPDEAWKTEGGETDDNIWTTCTVCRGCWDIFLKQESKEAQAASLRENYSDPY